MECRTFFSLCYSKANKFQAIRSSRLVSYSCHIYVSVSEELYYIDLLEYIFYVFRGFNYKLYYNITLTDGLSLNDNNNNNSNNNRHKMSPIIFLNVGYVEKILAEKEFMQSSVYLMLLLCN